MSVLLTFCIVAVGTNAPSDAHARYPEAVEIFHCGFEETWDRNFNAWPDGWLRKQGPGYPRWVKVEIVEEPSAEGARCLRFDMDGGAAAALGPSVPIDARHSYVLEVRLKTEGLEFDWARFSLTLQDENRHPLETFSSEKVRYSNGWQKLRIGPITPSSNQVRAASVALHVEPDDREDLQGSVRFDDVWLGRLPRLALRTNDPHNFFAEAAGVEIHCGISGSLDASPEVEFVLEDVTGVVLARLKQRFKIDPPDTDAPDTDASDTDRPNADAPNADVPDADATEDSASDDVSAEPPETSGQTTWQPEIPGSGYYRVRATIRGNAGLVQQRELSLVVVEPARCPPGGDFGWTIPSGNRPMPLPQLAQLIAAAGVNWVKFPLWYGEDADPKQIEQLLAFAERLGTQGVELVGLLDEPPEPLRSQYGRPSAALPAADVFDPEPETWYPSLEPTMTRLATRVHWWQLGHDTDTSFVGHPNLLAKVAEVKSELDRVGQDVNVAIPWSWLAAIPAADDGNLPWRAMTFSAQPPLTHEELAAYLDVDGTAQPGETRHGRFARWVTLEPIPAGVYPVEVRAADLVRRMMAAKMHGADAVFCPNPFGDGHGLIHDDGTPGELFLPWRTAAMLLSGSTYIGSIQLPGGSPNHIFSRDGKAVMVVWNEQPTEEVIYLGEDVRRIDIWGRSETPQQQDHRQVIRVGRLPTFVTGLSESIALWRMGVSIERKQIPSIFGRPHPNAVNFENTYGRGLGGEAELILPEVWQVTPSRIAFHLAAGEALQQDFQIAFPFTAASGRHKIRVDFQINGERLDRFSVYRQMDVGLGNVTVEVISRLNSQGELEVRQRLVNSTDSIVNFRCQLFVPGRRPSKTQIIGLARGADVRIYRLPNGQELIGKSLRLRAAEMDGSRVLNYPFVATR